MRQTVGTVIPLLLGAVIASMAVPAAASAASEVTPFPRATVIETADDPRSLPREFVTSAVERTRREVRIRHSTRVTAPLAATTWQMPSGVRLDDVVEHYRREMAVGLVFECRGRDCGRSNGWANNVFEQAVLYGPDQNQFYAASERDGKLIAAYVIERGNRRIYAHVRVLAPEDAVGPEANASFTRDLSGNGYAVVQGAVPRLDGTLPGTVEQQLADLAPRLDIFERQEVYVVCHLDGSGRTSEVLASAERCAANVVEQLTREGGPSLVPFGAGPLLPREGARASRIELVLPQHRDR